MGQDRGYHSDNCEPGLYWNADKSTQRYNTVEQQTNWEFCDGGVGVFSSEYCCETCPSGTYRETTEKLPPVETCKLCARGKYYHHYVPCESECHTKSYTECTNCAEGFYSSELGSTSCKHCPGFNMVANVERCSCVGGGYGFEGSGIFDHDTFECVWCEEGKTATRINEEPYWSDGFSSVGLGGWNFESDVPDYKCLHNTIPSCNNNEYYDIVFDLCKACPVGQYVFYTSDVSNTNVPGSYICKFIPQCEPGKAFDTSIPSCVDCEAGKYTTTVNYGDASVTECVDCPIHFYSLGGFSTCIPCEAGKFQFLPGQSSCENKCPAGYYYQEYECKKCTQDNTFTDEENLFSECLQCPIGKRSFYDESSGNLLTECLDCDECPVGKYRTGCSGSEEGTCEDCHECKEGEINVGCRWTKLQNEQSGVCFPEELVVRTPTCPEPGKSDESSSGLGGFSFKTLFGLNEEEVDFQCSTPCVGSPTEDGGYCDGPHPCNIRACSMTSSDNIFDFQDKDGVAGQTFRLARACPVEFDENELEDTEYLEFRNFTRINQKRKIRCQSCLDCGSSGLDENAQHVNNYGRGCAHECTLLLCQVGEIWDWTRKQCVHCNELDDMRLCVSSDIDLTARDISGNRPRILVGGDSCKEKPPPITFASNFKATYGECTECATETCPDSYYHASCREQHCQACLPHTSTNIYVPLHTQEFLDDSFHKRLMFCQFWGCEDGKTGVKNNGELCSASCLETQCRESDIHLDCILPHLSNRCIPNILSSQNKFGMLQESFVVGSQSNILEPLGIDSHYLHSSFENAIIVLSEEASEDYLFQCVWNAIDIKENFYDPGGISNTFFPEMQVLADQLSARGSKHCHERTAESSVKYQSLPLQNVVSFENYEQHRILLDNPARVMAWDRYTGRGGCYVDVDCPQDIDASALKKPPVATSRGLTGAYLGDLFLAMHMKNTRTSSLLIPISQTRISTLSWVNRWQISFWASVLTAESDSVFVNIAQNYETTLRKKVDGFNFTINGRINEISEEVSMNIQLSDYMNSSKPLWFPRLLPQKVYCYGAVMQFKSKDTGVPLKTFISQKYDSLSGEFNTKAFTRNLYEISIKKCHRSNVNGIESPEDILAFKRFVGIDSDPEVYERIIVVNKNYIATYSLDLNSVLTSSKYYLFGAQVKNLMIDANILKIYAGGDTTNYLYKFVLLYALRLPQTSGNILGSPFLTVKFKHMDYGYLVSGIVPTLSLADGTRILSKCAACVEEYTLPVVVAFSALSTEISSGFLQLLTPQVVLRDDWHTSNSDWQLILQLKNIELDDTENSEIIVQDITETSIVYNKGWSIMHSLHQIEAHNFIFDANNENVNDNTLNSTFRESNQLQVVSVLCPIELSISCTLHATFVSYMAVEGKKSMAVKEQIFVQLRESRYESITTLSMPDLSLIVNVQSANDKKIYRAYNVKHSVFQEVFDSIFHDRSVFAMLDHSYITLDKSTDTNQVFLVGKLEGFSTDSDKGYCIATEYELEFFANAVSYYLPYEPLSNFALINSSDVLDMVYSNKNQEDLIKTPSYIRLHEHELQDFEICFENKFTTKYRYLNFLLGPNSGLRFTCIDCSLDNSVPRDHLSVLTDPEREYVADKYQTPNEAYSTCPENYFRIIEIPQSSMWYPSYHTCDTYIECPYNSWNYESLTEYTNACKDVCDKAYGIVEGNWKEGYMYCFGIYMDEPSQKYRICSSELNVAGSVDVLAFQRILLPQSYCHSCMANEIAPAGSYDISACDCDNLYTRNENGVCTIDFAVKANEYIQIRFEKNSPLVEYLVYEKPNSKFSTKDALTLHSRQPTVVNVGETEKVCLVGNVSITDIYESDDEMFGVSGLIGSSLYPYSTEEIKLSAEWKPYVWVGSHKYESGNQFLKLNFERKSDFFWQDLTQDVTVGIDGLQLLPLLNLPHTSNAFHNLALTFVTIPQKQDLVLSGIAEFMSGNDVDNWEKFFTNIQIFGTSCTYRISIIPLSEDSSLDEPLPGSAIDSMGCTIVSPGICQLEIPTQLLNSQRHIAIMARSVDDQNSTSLQPANKDCYLQDSADENFETSGHQFLVTVLPFQRIYQCDKNHFWSETDQLCKSCNDHNVICALGEYIQGCDVLGLNITCIPCPIPENTNLDTFTWGDNCEILCGEGYYKTDEGQCLQCTSDLQSTCFKTPGLKYQACSAYANEECVPCEPIAMGVYGAYEIFSNASECATTCMEGTFRDIFKVPENSEWENKLYYICDEYIEIPYEEFDPSQSIPDADYLSFCKSACDNPAILNNNSDSIKCNGFYRTATQPHSCRICLSEMYELNPAGFDHATYPDVVFHWDGFGRTIPMSGSNLCIPCTSHTDAISKAKLTRDPNAYYRTVPCTETSNTLAESCNLEKLIKNGTYISDAPAADTDDNGLARDCLIDCPDGWHLVAKTYTRHLDSEKVPVAQWSGYDCVLCDTFDSSGVKLPSYSFTVDDKCDLTCNHSAHYYHRGENMTIGGITSATPTCSYCNPTECEVGTFMTGMYSQSCQCHNCTLKYNGLIFTSEGKTLDDSSSCKQECPYGSFGNEFLRKCIPWTPMDETFCGDGFYFKQGTPFTDAMCLPCTQCTNSREEQPCTSTTDAVCILCPDAGPGAIYENSDCTVTCIDGFKFNQVTQKCEDCRGFQCPPGSILSSASYNCSHCITCNNSIPSNSTYVFECTWKCYPGHFYNIHEHSCVEYSNYVQYSSTISEKLTVSCPYDHYLTGDFSCDQCENHPDQNPSNLKPEDTSTWSWVPSIKPCTWECNPPLVYFVHIAFYQHTSPKCYTVQERDMILEEEQNTDLAISDNTITLSKKASNPDVLSPILVNFFIIFAIFMFVFAFFYPLLFGSREDIEEVEEVEEVEETTSQQKDLDQRPDTTQKENNYV